ncbi:MAG: 50S ribosomal protein L25 [Candidatus Chisholmbacteria bacterium]|nr:50S ribosomal protein L25 [Candidatus Chisholmbacteria bacterium]
MPTKSRPQLSAEKRTLTGRKVKTLRRQGILPATVFGKHVKSVTVQVPLQSFAKVADEVGETGLVDLNIKGDKTPRPVLISNIQQDPVTANFIHTDFHQVDLTEKVTAPIPIELTGESPAVKEKSAVLITLLDEIEIEALPTDLPEKFTVDISSLKEFNDSILVKDLKVDTTKITLKVDPAAQIVMVQEPKEEEIAPPPPAEVEAAAPAEGAAPSEAPAEEGSQPVATEEKPPEEKPSPAK